MKKSISIYVQIYPAQCFIHRQTNPNESQSPENVSTQGQQYFTDGIVQRPPSSWALTPRGPQTASGPLLLLLFVQFLVVLWVQRHAALDVVFALRVLLRVRSSIVAELLDLFLRKRGARLDAD